MFYYLYYNNLSKLHFATFWELILLAPLQVVKREFLIQTLDWMVLEISIQDCLDGLVIFLGLM